jgi:hypothetical protein
MNGNYAYKGYPQRPFPRNNGENVIDMTGDNMASFMGDGQSLDDMVMQNEKENRRLSMPVYGGAPMQMGSPDSRRLSMLQFGDSAAIDDFQFDGSMQNLHDMRNGAFPSTASDMQNGPMAASDLAINTQFSNANSPFANPMAYASPMHQGANLDMDMTSPYPNMQMPLDKSLMMGHNDMNMFPDAQFNTPMMNSPATQDFTSLPSGQPQDSNTSMSIPDQYRSHSSSATPDARPKPSTRDSSQEQGSLRSNSRPQSEQHTSSNSVPTATQMVDASLQSQQPVGLSTAQDLPPDHFGQIKFPWDIPQGGFPSSKDHNPHMKTQFKNAYSSTGFDMLGVLVCSGCKVPCV